MKLKFPFSRFIVFDHSMEPYCFPDDRVLTFNWKVNYKNGDVLVLKFGKRLVIKRIDAIGKKYVWVSGDNKKMTAKYPKIRLSAILGKVIFKY